MRNKYAENINVRNRECNVTRGLLIQLVSRLIYIVVVILIMTVIVFGIYRVADDSMEPGMKAGDVVLVYRLQKNYLQNDLTVTEQDGELQIRRITAVEGDCVEINEEGLVINDRLQNESNIYEETMAYEEGIGYPIELREGELFLLADARENACDSRYYGPVGKSETKGMVIAVLRHNGL